MPRKTLTSSRCQCSGCGGYFNSMTAFDGHRIGSYRTARQPGTRRCLTEAEMRAKGWSINDAGFWITSERDAEALTAQLGAAIDIDPLPTQGGAA